MNTARIVVLTMALGIGSVAAQLASGSDNKPSPTEPAAQLQSVDVSERSETLAPTRQTDTLSLALSKSSKGRTI